MAKWGENIQKGPTMRTETPVQIKLADYAPYPFAIDQVEMHFDLEPSATKVRTRMQVRRLGAGDLVLDGVQVNLDSIALDGTELTADAYQARNGRIVDRQVEDVGDPADVGLGGGAHTDRHGGCSVPGSMHGRPASPG